MGYVKLTGSEEICVKLIAVLLISFIASACAPKKDTPPALADVSISTNDTFLLIKYIKSTKKIHPGLIYTAIEHNNLNLLEILLHHGANPNSLPAHEKRSAFEYAIRKNSVEAAEKLSNYGAVIDLNNRRIKEAISKSSPKMKRFIAYSNKRPELIKAIYRNDLTSFLENSKSSGSLTEKDWNGLNAMQVAADTMSDHFINVMIAKHPKTVSNYSNNVLKRRFDYSSYRKVFNYLDDIDFFFPKDLHPFYRSASVERYKIPWTHLQSWVMDSAKDSSLIEHSTLYKEIYSQTYLVAERVKKQSIHANIDLTKYPELLNSVFKKLLDMGGDPNKIKYEDGTYLIHKLALIKNIELIETLHKKGANLNAKDAYNRTALFYIYYHSGSELDARIKAIINKVIELGVNPNLKNKSGRTARTEYNTLRKSYQSGYKKALEIVAAENKRIKEEAARNKAQCDQKIDELYYLSIPIRNNSSKKDMTSTVIHVMSIGEDVPGFSAAFYSHPKIKKLDPECQTRLFDIKLAHKKEQIEREHEQYLEEKRENRKRITEQQRLMRDAVNETRQWTNSHIERVNKDIERTNSYYNNDIARQQQYEGNTRSSNSGYTDQVNNDSQEQRQTVPAWRSNLGGGCDSERASLIQQCISDCNSIQDRYEVAGCKNSCDSKFSGMCKSDRDPMDYTPGAVAE